MTAPKSLDTRDLIRIAERAGLAIRHNHGHTMVTLPTGKTAVFRRDLGRNGESRKLHVQVKAFQEAGLL